MRIGFTWPRYQDFGLLRPESSRLQSALFENRFVLIRLCKQVVPSLKNPFWSQLWSFLLIPFESEYGGFHLVELAYKVALAFDQAQVAEEMNKFRQIVKNFLYTLTRDTEEVRKWKRRKEEWTEGFRNVVQQLREKITKTISSYQLTKATLDKNPPRSTSDQQQQQEQQIWHKRLSLVNLRTYSHWERELVSTWSNISGYFTKLLMAFGLLEESVQTDKKRIRWTCHCGYSSFDDFVELRPGAIDAYETLLRERSSTQHLSQSTTNRTGFFRSLWDPRTIFSFLGKQTAIPDLLPKFELTEIGTNSQTRALTPSADDLFLLLCVPHKQYATRLVHLNLRAIESDQEFFYSLRRDYRSRRGIVRSLLSLRTLKKVKFVKFEMYKSELVDIRKVDDLPPVDRRDEYRYQPMPAEFIPPVGEHHMMHLCTHPEDADETRVCLDRIPKKLKERLLVCPSNGTGIGWGVYFVEGWHYTLAWLLAFVTLLVSSLVFLICWAVLRHDLQSASGVAAYMLAFVALCVGTVQAALELY